MSYSDETRNRAYYKNSEYDLDEEGRQQYEVSRDVYDKSMNTRHTNFLDRHTEQLNRATGIQKNDKGWIKDKDAVRQFNMNIRQRQGNYNTYKNQLEMEQVLYNRERHATVYLSVANIFALGACIFMWTSSSN